MAAAIIRIVVIRGESLRIIPWLSKFLFPDTRKKYIKINSQPSCQKYHQFF